MKMKKIIFVFSCFFTLYSCAEYSINKKDIQKKEKNYFSSAGFALIYNDNLKGIKSTPLSSGAEFYLK